MKVQFSCTTLFENENVIWVFDSVTETVLVHQFNISAKRRREEDEILSFVR